MRGCGRKLFCFTIGMAPSCSAGFSNIVTGSVIPRVSIQDVFRLARPQDISLNEATQKLARQQ